MTALRSDFKQASTKKLIDHVMNLMIMKETPKQTVDINFQVHLLTVSKRVLPFLYVHTNCNIYFVFPSIWYEDYGLQITIIFLQIMEQMKTNY